MVRAGVNRLRPLVGKNDRRRCIGTMACKGGSCTPRPSLCTLRREKGTSQDVPDRPSLQACDANQPFLRLGVAADLHFLSPCLISYPLQLRTIPPPSRGSHQETPWWEKIRQRITFIIIIMVAPALSCSSCARSSLSRVAVEHVIATIKVSLHCEGKVKQ